MKVIRIGAERTSWLIGDDKSAARDVAGESLRAAGCVGEGGGRYSAAMDSAVEGAMRAWCSTSDEIVHTAKNVAATMPIEMNLIPHAA